MPAEEPCAPSAPGAPGAWGAQRVPGPELRLTSQLLPELYAFVARVLFYLAPVYLAGYLGLSVLWLLLGVLLWMWWRRNRRGKLGRLEAAFDFLNNERQFISRELRGQHLPAWVSRAGRGRGGRCGARAAGARRRREAGPRHRTRLPREPGGVQGMAGGLGAGAGPSLQRWERETWVSLKAQSRVKSQAGHTQEENKDARDSAKLLVRETEGSCSTAC